MKPDTPMIKSTQHGHEVSDANAGGIGLFMVLFVLSGLALLPVLWGLFSLLVRHEIRADAPAVPMAATHSNPPPPTLQPSPRHRNIPADDMADLRLRQERQLHSFGWVDRPADIAHIPIDRAMTLLVERGFPSPATQPSERYQSGGAQQ